jgi:hypothetical protein
MEQHSLHGGAAMVPARWSKKWQTCLQKTTFLKNGHQKNTPPKTTLFSPFLPNFITFYILQHYGRHVTRSPLLAQEHKGNPRNWEGGRRISDDVSFFQI